VECFMCNQEQPPDEAMAFAAISSPMAQDKVAEVHHEDDTIIFEAGSYELVLCMECAGALHQLFGRFIFAPGQR